jgi:hypothetical protein
MSSRRSESGMSLCSRSARSFRSGGSRSRRTPTIVSRVTSSHPLTAEVDEMQEDYSLLSSPSCIDTASSYLNMEGSRAGTRTGAIRSRPPTDFGSVRSRASSQNGSIRNHIAPSIASARSRTVTQVGSVRSSRSRASTLASHRENDMAPVWTERRHMLESIAEKREQEHEEARRWDRLERQRFDEAQQYGAGYQDGLCDAASCAPSICYHPVCCTHTVICHPIHYVQPRVLELPAAIYERKPEQPQSQSKSKWKAFDLRPWKR